MTSAEILDFAGAVVEADPFKYERAKEPFSFELQPATEIDQQYHITLGLDSVTGYLGFAQAQIELLRIYLSRKVRRDPHTAYAQIVTDVGSLVAGVIRASDGLDFNVEFRSWEVPDPGPEDAYIVGLASFAVDYDRAL
jgi:hypothetical protein